MEQPFQALAEHIASVAPQVAAATADSDDQALRRRPEPGAWCVLEVVGHLIDKMAIWRARVEAIASQEQPHLDLYDQDALVGAQSYRTARLCGLLEQLTAGCAAFAGTVRALPEEAARRTGFRPDHGQVALRQCIEIPLASVGPHLSQLRAALANHVVGG